MPTLDSSANSVKLLKEGRRLEREPFRAVSDAQRWTARCMHLDCEWSVEGLFSEDAARTGGKLHNDATGHPVKLRAVIEFECGIIRAEVR